MSDIHQQLITLYSEAPVKQVHASKIYQKLRQQNEGDHTFDKENNLIEMTRSAIDELFSESASYREQVHLALRFLRRPDTEEKKKLARTLILNSYASKWSPKQRRYFKRMSLLMIYGYDYFLSFTSRNLNAGKQNQINTAHLHFIRNALGGAFYDQADLTKTNLVAESVHYHLTDLPLRGFYYPAHENDNDVVKRKLTRNAKRSLAFVQLIQGAMFAFIPKSPNWCFFEYMKVHKRHTKRILFVQIQPSILEETVAKDFDRWYKYYTNKDSLKLQETRACVDSVINDNVNKIRENLRNQIRTAVDQIYLAIPD